MEKSFQYDHSISISSNNIFKQSQATLDFMETYASTFQDELPVYVPPTKSSDKETINDDHIVPDDSK